MTTGEVIALIKAFGGGGGGSSGGGVRVVNDVEGTLDKTWQECRDALVNGNIVTIGYSDGYSGGTTIVDYARATVDSYELYMVGHGPGTDDPVYIATTQNGYPVINDD